MPARDFERLLHPIFEEDEFTLIAVGGVLGVAAAWAQAAWGERAAAGVADAWRRGRDAFGRARRRLFGGGEVAR